MEPQELHLAHRELRGYRIWASNYIFAPYHFRPSYWFILKREGFSGDIFRASSELSHITDQFNSYTIHDLFHLVGETPPEKGFFGNAQRDALETLILSGQIKVFQVDHKLAERMQNIDDPIYYNYHDHATTGTPVSRMRDDLAEELAMDIFARWVGKDKVDRLHWSKTFINRELAEAYDVAAEAVDTVADLIVGLWDIVKFTVKLAGDGLVLVFDVSVAVAQFQMKLATGDIEGVKQDLQALGIEVTDALESADKLIKKAKEGYDIFQQLTNDPSTQRLIIDYLESLWETIPYRDSRTIGVRIVSEIGVEVLLALATGGTGNIARRAAQAGAKSAKAAKATRIGPFTAKAIDMMVDLAGQIKTAQKVRKSSSQKWVNGNEGWESLPSQPRNNERFPPARPKPEPEPKPVADEVTELEPGDKGSWNKALNGDLKPNHKYKVGNHLYETDDAGRVSRVSGKLDLNTRDRNTYQQVKSAKEAGIKDGLSDDDGGHLIASIFDGPGEQINYAPMNSNLNRGAWKRMENKWADALKEGKDVKVDIQPVYDGASKRPEAFEVQYWIDGKLHEAAFENIPGG